MKASIKNTSDYTLLAGVTKVYVDGSFIAKATIPLVSPQETFVCPLGYVTFPYYYTSTLDD